MKTRKSCAVCGQDFDAEVDSETGKVLSGAYFGKMNFRKWFRQTWSLKFLSPEERCFMLQKAPLWRLILWRIWPGYSFPEQDCTVPNWKKPFLKFYWWIYNIAHPITEEETPEYWECPKCFNS